MIVEIPQIEYILHANIEKMDYVQNEYLKIFNACNHFFNITFESLLDRISRQYNSTSVIQILDMVNNTLGEEENSCKTIIYDDFVRNASLVSQALHKIISSPSQKLIKVNKNEPANKVTRFDSRTMTWLSRRPGTTIEEKISPKNIIPTRVTQFTTDTVENRHTMYLYDILFDNLFKKIYPDDHVLQCENCKNNDKKCFILYEKLKTLLLLKNKIRSAHLYDVPKQKQIKQNNKLLSDKEYKQIWDAVRDIDYFEYNCKTIWSNLKQRYQFLIFLIICARLSKYDDVLVYDTLCNINDVNGFLSITNDDDIENHIRLYSKSLNKEFSVRLISEEIHVSIYDYKELIKNHYIKVNEYHKQSNLDSIFDFLENIYKNEINFNEAKRRIQMIKQELLTSKNKLDDLYSKKSILEELSRMLILMKKEIKLNGEEKQESQKKE